MDHGSWLWKTKTSEKMNEKPLQEKLISLLNECNAQDEAISSQSKAAHEAMTGWEKVEVEAKLRKQKLDEALKKKIAERERFYAELKNCVQQFLSSAKEEEDKRVKEAVIKATKELENKHKNLEEKYEETSSMVATLTFENSQLTTALQVKEKLIDETNEKMARVDLSEKEYVFLKFEFQKLEIRNEEMDRSAKASEKKDLENVKKIKKLETELRRLRVLRNLSEQRVERLQLKLEILEESKSLLEGEIGNVKLINEDLDKQLNASRDQSNELFKKIMTLEAELEDRSHCYEQLETTCFRLLHQLESVSSKDTTKDDEEKDENPFHAAWEITELVECRETLETPRKNAAVLEKVLSVSSDRTLSQHSSLRECLAEDGFEAADPNSSPKMKEIISTGEMKNPPIVESSNNPSATAPAEATLAIVATKKRGGGFNLLRRIFFMRKKGGNKKKSRYRSTWQI